MSDGPEKLLVEDPFVAQLVSMGWKHIPGNLDYPSVTGRESFGDVLLLDDLRRALRRINRGEDGVDWLDEARVATAVSALTRLGATGLMEANQAAHELLMKGAPVDGVPGRDGGRAQTVHYIDWSDPSNNQFTVVSQLRVDEPRGRAHGFITPDLVLFVNGIPLVVVECKSPRIPEPIASAVDQLQRYANQRSWVDQDEGNERLFHYNAFVVATCFDEARAATVGASSEHYLEWKDTSPVDPKEVAASLCKSSLSSQETLVAGMLRPAHLIDLLRHFVAFEVDGGRTLKKVARYQQFRAVLAAIERLEMGQTRLQHGEHDQRGGIVWHTQGSGKTLTMVFLVRRMRTRPSLRRFKVIVVTDRKELQRQLAEVFELSGDTVARPRNMAALRGALAVRGPGLVLSMIQKYRDDLSGGSTRFEPLPVLNTDESVLVIVDEAHRSHGSALHASLLHALPNCARIGFTGTPILMGAKKKTHEIFGAFIDRYTLRQSQADGSTVPILYEGRTTRGQVTEGRDLDEVFEDMFQERSPEELEAIKAKYATTGNVLEAERLIAAKAKNMLRHYVDNILPNGFKAQVVAVSRLAAVRYHAAFLTARAELVREIRGLSRAALDADEAEASRLPDRTRFLLRAHRHLARIEALEFATVISGAHNDPEDWAVWTDGDRAEARIANYKKPFEHPDPERRSNLAFLIVKSMLITGFDAPIAAVQYLDRNIQEAELLQAIARVNRTARDKRAGIVVDYYGVAGHLKSALKAYAAEDVDGALRSLQDELPTLRDRHLRVVGLFTDRDAELSDEEACVDLLTDERLRAEFAVKLRQFLDSLETVLPRPEGLPYVQDARRLGAIALRARNRYRDAATGSLGKDVGAKVRALIDEHVISLGIDPKIPPVSILDTAFDRQVRASPTARSRASEMEHALRHHLRQHMSEDPERYGKLSAHLESILAEFKTRWEEIERELKKLIDEARAGRSAEIPGLDPVIHAPFFGVLRMALVGDGSLAPDLQQGLAELTVALVAHVRAEIQRVGFWSNPHAQGVLRRWIVVTIDDHGLLDYEKLPELADRLMEVAKANHPRLVR